MTDEPDRTVARGLLAGGLWVTLLVNVTAFRAVLVNRALMASMAERQAEIGAAQRVLLSEQRKATARSVQARLDRQRIVDLLVADQAARLEERRRTQDVLRSIVARDPRHAAGRVAPDRRNDTVKPLI